jgi:predicted NodU family carbamoyl transferase
VTARVVIGINDGHNASVAVVRDGELTRAIQEERLSRSSSTKVGFPREGLFRSLTGRSAPLNTSMNLHREPLVHTVKDAVDLLTCSGLKHAMLENVLVQKVPIKS